LKGCDFSTAMKGIRVKQGEDKMANETTTVAATDVLEMFERSNVNFFK